VQQNKKLFIASFWVILIFGLSQILRFGSNLIVTRILEPEIFGVMAVVSVVIFGVTMFTDLGLWAFVVRHKTPEDPHVLNVVWTLQVLRGWAMFSFIALMIIIFVIASKKMPNHFQGVYADPRLPLLILVASISSVISGYTTMVSPLMSLKFELRKLELINFFSQTTSVIVMLILVWVYPSIWVLLSAGLLSAIVSTLSSYYFFPFRHKLVWDKAIAKEVFHFSKWIVIASALTYLFSQGDRLFFAGKIDASQLGVYSLAFMLAATLISVTQMLASKIVFPIFANIVNNNRQSLKDKYYKIRLYLDAPLFLAAGLLIALGPLIVSILYDARYSDAGWILQILAFAVIGETLLTVSMECLSALSITKIRMWVMVVRTLALFIGLPFFFNHYGFYGAIWVVAVNALLALPLVYYTLARNSVFSLIREIRMLPLLGLGYVLGKALIILFISN
jgi:O-antigen/teichoic acid export membrane protein